VYAVPSYETGRYAESVSYAGDLSVIT